MVLSPFALRGIVLVAGLMLGMASLAIAVVFWMLQYGTEQVRRAWKWVRRSGRRSELPGYAGPV